MAFYGSCTVRAIVVLRCHPTHDTLPQFLWLGANIGLYFGFHYRFELGIKYYYLRKILGVRERPDFVGFVLHPVVCAFLVGAGRCSRQRSLSKFQLHADLDTGVPKFDLDDARLLQGKRRNVRADGRVPVWNSLPILICRSAPRDLYVGY